MREGIARVVDATRVIRILSDDRHVRTVFGECGTIISDLV